MKALKLLSVAIGLLLGTSALHATAIDYVAAINGLAPSPVYSFSATGGSVVLGNKNNVKFVGVSGGGAGTEIDIGQSLTVAFSAPELVSSLSFALLFNGPEYKDFNEIASAYTSSGDIYQLKVVGENTANWYKNSIFISTVAGFGTNLGGEGKFVVANPFGFSAVTNFKLYPSNNPQRPAGSNASDFGLSAFSLVNVPDTGSVLSLMGATLIGLSWLNRRKRN